MCAFISDDDDTGSCSTVDDDDDDDLIFVGISPATISEDEDDADKNKSADDDIVFISQSSPRVEEVKTEGSVPAVSNEDAPLSGYDPFGSKDSTDWLGLSPTLKPDDKPCSWESNSDLNTPTVVDLNSPGIDLNSNVSLNTPAMPMDTETEAATSNLLKSQVLDTPICQSQDVTDVCGNPKSSGSVLISNNDPMISGQDSSDISQLLHQLKSLAECTKLTTTATDTTVSTSGSSSDRSVQVCRVRPFGTVPVGLIPTSRPSSSSTCDKSRLKRSSSNDCHRILPKKERCDNSNIDNNGDLSITMTSCLALGNPCGTGPTSTASTQVLCNSAPACSGNQPLSDSKLCHLWNKSTSSMPPKARLKLSKQSFCGSVGGTSTCSSCGKENTGKAYSACLLGHYTCKTCLEMSAKALLTNSKKVGLQI